MAQVGQTTPSGGREWSISRTMCALRRIVLPTAATLNHIGCWVREQTTANTNDLVGTILTEEGVLLHQTSVVTTPVGNTSFVGTAQQIPFAGGVSLPAGTYLIAVAAGPTTSSNIILQGQTDSTGLPTWSSDDENLIYYPTWTSDLSTGIHTDAARAWDMYLDYTEASLASGDLDATESGADDFEATGGVGNNGLRLTLRDTDTGALAANLTGLIVAVRTTSNAATTLYSTTSGTTNASGVYELASTAIGNLGDYVFVTVEKSDHSIGALFRVQVIDLNA